MPRLILLLVLLLGVPCAGAAAEDPTVPVLPFETYVLSNGLRVILHEDHRLPLATVNLWYYVGGRDESPGHSGFAHLFEHLMFMGTKRVPTGQFDALMEGAGGSNNASTSFDRTNYFDSGPSALLPTLLWLEADRMEDLGPAMTPEKLRLQQDVVRNERRQTNEIAPYGLTELAIFENMYPEGHPYRGALIGSHADIEASTVEDVRLFHKRFYVPNNASLVVAGDFVPEVVKPLIESLFGSLPRGEDPARNVIHPVVLPGPRRLTVVDPNVELERLSFVFHSPAFFAEGDAEMDLLASVLTEGKTSRLYKRLVYEEKLASDVSSHQQSMALGSLFQIDATATPGASLEALEKAVWEELERLKGQGPKVEETARAVNLLETQRIGELESVAARADLLNHYQFWLGRPDGLAQDLARYRRPDVWAPMRTWAEHIFRRQQSLVVRTVTPPTLGSGSRETRPGDATSGSFTIPVPEVFTLKNGLRVWHVRREGLPLVSLRLAAEAGSVHDPVGKSGLAALANDMLDEGAGGRDALRFSQAVSDLGASLAAYTERDGASLSMEVLTRNLAPALALFASAASAPTLAEADVERVKALRKAALEQEEADPTGVARRLGMEAWFGAGHPYGSPVNGRPASLATLGAAEVRAFVAARYRPERCVLLTGGDVTRAQLEPLLEQALGAWKSAGESAEPPRAGAPAGQGRGLRVIVVDRAEAPQTVIRFVLPAPTYAAPERLSLEALNTIFGASFTSRLNGNLREDKGYTYGAGSSVATLRQGGTLIASSSVRSGVTGPAVSEFLKEFTRIATGDVTEAEAQKASATRRHETVESVSTLSGLLAGYGDLVDQGREPSGFAADVERVNQGVTAAELNVLARRHLALKDAVLVLVGDKTTILAQLEGLGLPPPEIVTE